MSFKCKIQGIGVFSKWGKTFIEFSEFGVFRECDKPLKYELGELCVLLVL